jgi:endoglucanase
LRVPFWLGLDYRWYRDPRDKEVLSEFGFLEKQWNTNKLLYAIYNHNGTTNVYYQSDAMYGGSMGYFTVINPAAAHAIYMNKLVKLYNPNSQSWKGHVNYYDDNWAWFGMAFYDHLLPNLTANG